MFLTEGSTSEITARYTENDQMGFIHHSNHIIWFEIARMKLFRDSGIDLMELEKENIFLPVLSIGAKYISPAFFEDRVKVNACFTGKSNVRIMIDYIITDSSGKKLCTGNSEHAFIRGTDNSTMLIHKEIDRKIIITERNQ